MGHPATDVAVIGGGTIGLAIAWRAAQAGMSVTLADPDPGRGAWRTAAGMLAPITELHYTETDLLRLNLDSAAMFSGFVTELESATDLEAGYRECGTVQIAWDAADLVALRDLHTFGTGLGLPSTMLTPADLRRREPGLAAGLPGGLYADRDHQVDPRRLHAALAEAVRRAGVRVVPAAVSVRVAEGRAVGIASGAEFYPAGTTVVAAGAWSSQLGVACIPTVRPVKGQTLRLRIPAGMRLEHVVRGNVKGSAIYVVPRDNGEIVVGASSEEAGFDVRPRAGAVYELLRDAQSVLPELSEAELVEVNTGLRPGTADNAPLLGPSELEGLVLATGHYRNGILLTPVTAAGIAALLTTGELLATIAPFTPQRHAVTA